MSDVADLDGENAITQNYGDEPITEGDSVNPREFDEAVRLGSEMNYGPTDGCLHDDCIHCAWLDVIDVLPEGWTFDELIQLDTEWIARSAHPDDGLVTLDSLRAQGTGPTPTAALQALAHALHDRLQSRGKEPDR